MRVIIFTVFLLSSLAALGQNNLKRPLDCPDVAVVCWKGPAPQCPTKVLKTINTCWSWTEGCQPCNKKITCASLQAECNSNPQFSDFCQGNCSVELDPVGGAYVGESCDVCRPFLNKS